MEGMEVIPLNQLWTKYFTKKSTWMIASVLFVFIISLSTYSLAMKFLNTDDIVLVSDLTCEFREEVYLKDFIHQLDGKLLNNKQIDTTEVGIKELEIQYKNHYGLTVRKKFNIEVLDVTEPTVVVANPYVVEKGSIEKLEDTIFCADDYDDEVECKITGQYDLSKIGKYNLAITATDHSNNSVKKEFVLEVVSKQEVNNNINSNQYTKFKDIYQKYKTKDTLIGLDLSKWQQEVDFTKLASAGVTFVMLKLGGQKEIGGEITVDPKFYENIEKAIENNMQVGVYFYSYAKTEKEAQAQAKWVSQKVKDYSITLPIAFDWENWNSYTTFHISFHTLNKIAITFLDEVEKSGYQVMLYSSKYYLETIWYRENYPVWLAYYTDNNDYEGNYLLWQVCNNGKVAGIDGYVDIDVMYLDQ